MKNWKTTVAGFAAGFLSLYANGMNAKSAATAAGLALIGSLAKDSDVTGVGSAATRQP
jgi:hypothetical protein